MNLIFLDIDGVLNNNDTKERFCRYCGIDEKLLNSFCRILSSCDVKIVLSSTWRIKDDSCIHVLENFNRLGFHDVVVGRTPLYPFQYGRGEEIKQWVEFNKSIIDKYVIIDDDLNAMHGIIQDERIKCLHVITLERDGIMKKDIDNIIQFLNRD